MKCLLSITALFVAIMLASTRDAHAYLDPGLGSMLLQGLIAGVAAASVVAGYYWGRLKSFLHTFKRRAPAENETSDQTTRR